MKVVKMTSMNLLFFNPFVLALLRYDGMWILFFLCLAAPYARALGSTSPALSPSLPSHPPVSDFKGINPNSSYQSENHQTGIFRDYRGNECAGNRSSLGRAESLSMYTAPSAPPSPPHPRPTHPTPPALLRGWPADCFPSATSDLHLSPCICI